MIVDPIGDHPVFRAWVFICDKAPHPVPIRWRGVGSQHSDALAEEGGWPVARLQLQAFLEPVPRFVPATGPIGAETVGAPPRVPAVLAGLKIQAQRCETTGDIETGAAFGADPDPDRSACGCPPVSAGERPWWQGDGWGDHRPDDHCILHVSDINAEFRDRARIMFRRTSCGHKGAVHLT